MACLGLKTVTLKLTAFHAADTLLTVLGKQFNWALRNVW